VNVAGMVVDMMLVPVAFVYVMHVAGLVAVVLVGVALVDIVKLHSLPPGMGSVD
jgi:hypothetical protein